MARDMYVIFGAWRRKGAEIPALPALLACSVILLGASVPACALARSWWVFDLASHFRPHYLGAALAAAAMALALRRRRTLLLIGLLALPHLVTVEPWRGLGAALAEVEEIPAAKSASLRVMTLNVNWANGDRPSAMEHIRDVAPDVLFLQEASTLWHREIAALSRAFPYKTSAGRLTVSGIHVFSRFPIATSKSIRPPGLGSRYLVTELEVAGKTVRAVSVHAPSPLAPGPRDRRNRYLRHLAETLSQNDVPTIVAGDFNMTRWSPHYGDLVEASGLTNAAEAQGWVATWPSQLPFGRIAIDHLLVSDQIKVRSFGRGSDVGSDHLPLIAELDLR